MEGNIIYSGSSSNMFMYLNYKLRSRDCYWLPSGEERSSNGHAPTSVLCEFQKHLPWL